MIWIFTRYYLGDQIVKNEMGGVCSTYGESRGAYRILVWKPERKRPRCRWEDNIQMELREAELGGGGGWNELMWPKVGGGGRVL